MQRNIMMALVVVILLLSAALAFVLLRGQSAPVPVSINAADENAVEPYRQEMDCIDRLMQNNDLDANEVGPAVARCQGGPSGNQSNGL